MKEPRTAYLVDYAHQDHDLYTRLALHVVWGAIADLGRKDPKGEKADALDFLVNRLNEPGNLWGELVRDAGAGALPIERIAALVRRAWLTRAPPAGPPGTPPRTAREKRVTK